MAVDSGPGWDDPFWARRRMTGRGLEKPEIRRAASKAGAVRPFRT
jgi:hypothetical protein